MCRAGLSEKDWSNFDVFHDKYYNLIKPISLCISLHIFLTVATIADFTSIDKMHLNPNFTDEPCRDACPDNRELA